MTDRGCYGLPSVYSHTSATCQSCVVRATCKDKALSVLQLVRGAIKVDDLIDAYRLSYVAAADVTITLTPEQRARVITAPTKLQRRLENLMLAGFDKVAAVAFKRGENPFREDGAKHLRLVGEKLLQGRVVKADLRAAFQRQFGWSTATAASEVSNAVAILSGLDLINETRFHLELRT
jgi:hypothetical protein